MNELVLLCLASAAMAALPVFDAIKVDFWRVRRDAACGISIVRFRGELYVETIFQWFDWPKHRRCRVFGRFGRYWEIKL